MSRPKLILTRRWPEAVEAAVAEKFDAVLNGADRPFDAAELREALASADAVLSTVTDRLDASVFGPEKPRARLIANFGVGTSHIDVAAADRCGIAVTNTPDVLSESTADLAILLMLMLARRAGEGERELRAGQWSGWRPTHLLGADVSGKVLGIVGFGRIGQEVARRARFGFGMRVIVSNRSPVGPDILAPLGAETRADVDAVIADADFISLHCPGGAANRHLIDARRLSLMKPTAFLINTARGEVVDEMALAAALRGRVIAGAGLDVYDGEPHVRPELLACDNIVLLPHLGSATRETREAMGFRALQNVEQFFAGRTPQDRVTP